MNKIDINFGTSIDIYTKTADATCFNWSPLVKFRLKHIILLKALKHLAKRETDSTKSEKTACF